MSDTVSTLLLRNLHDVFGEIDPVRRRKAVDEIFHPDAVFHEPNGTHRGRDDRGPLAIDLQPQQRFRMDIGETSLARGRAGESVICAPTGDAMPLASTFVRPAKPRRNG
jgi:hypothetical protein